MKKVTQKITGTVLAIMALAIFIIACNKSSTAPAGTPKNLSVFLTDDPCQFNAVFIDIKTVEVKVDEDLNHDGHFADNDMDKDNDNSDHDQYGKWDTLSIRAGIYNIMNFKNGIDTLLATGKIPAGRIGKIRITLGKNNSVVVSNISYPLLLSPNQNNFVYVKIEDDDLDENVGDQTSLHLDFDLCASIQERQGGYYLKPFIKAFGEEKFGRIQGSVLPEDAHSLVKIYSGKDTSNAIPNNGGGDFKVRGLKEGKYSVFYKASNGYKDTTINNVQVLKGKETQLPKITLHK